MRVTSQLFDLLSDNSSVDHPLCGECTDSLLQVGPACVGIIVYHTLWPGIGPLRGLQGAPRGLVLAQNASFGGLGGTRRAPGSQIWFQLPLAAVHKIDSW